jgi:superfamily II DNA/RNA helicase
MTMNYTLHRTSTSFCTIVLLPGVRVAVLDEADRLLDLGFEDQIRLLLTRRMPRTGEGGARGGRSALVVSWGS